MDVHELARALCSGPIRTFRREQWQVIAMAHVKAAELWPLIEAHTRASVEAANERGDRNAAAVDAQARAIAEAVEAERTACEAVARDVARTPFEIVTKGGLSADALVSVAGCLQTANFIATMIAARKGGPK